MGVRFFIFCLMLTACVISDVVYSRASLGGAKRPTYSASGAAESTLGDNFSRNDMEKHMYLLNNRSASVDFSDQAPHISASQNLSLRDDRAVSDDIFFSVAMPWLDVWKWGAQYPLPLQAAINWLKDIPHFIATHFTDNGAAMHCASGCYQAKSSEDATDEFCPYTSLSDHYSLEARHFFDDHSSIIMHDNVLSEQHDGIGIAVSHASAVVGPERRNVADFAQSEYADLLSSAVEWLSFQGPIKDSESAEDYEMLSAMAAPIQAESIMGDALRELQNEDDRGSVAPAQYALLLTTRAGASNLGFKNSHHNGQLNNTLDNQQSYHENHKRSGESHSMDVFYRSRLNDIEKNGDSFTRRIHAMPILKAHLLDIAQKPKKQGVIIGLREVEQYIASEPKHTPIRNSSQKSDRKRSSSSGVCSFEYVASNAQEESWDRASYRTPPRVAVKERSMCEELDSPYPYLGGHYEAPDRDQENRNPDAFFRRDNDDMSLAIERRNSMSFDDPPRSRAVSFDDWHVV